MAFSKLPNDAELKTLLGCIRDIFCYRCKRDFTIFITSAQVPSHPSEEEESFLKRTLEIINEYAPTATIARLLATFGSTVLKFLIRLITEFKS